MPLKKTILLSIFFYFIILFVVIEKVREAHMTEEKNLLVRQILVDRIRTDIVGMQSVNNFFVGEHPGM